LKEVKKPLFVAEKERREYRKQHRILCIGRGQKNMRSRWAGVSHNKREPKESESEGKEDRIEEAVEKDLS